MDRSTQSTRIGIVLLLILLGLVTRLIPHWPNFTALGAVALFGGSQLSPKWIAPLATFTVLVLTDLVIGFYSGFSIVYLAFILMTVQGMFMTKKTTNVLGHSVIASVMFFLITNFASWVGNPMYSQDIFGLFTSYYAGLPFMLPFLASTLVYGLGLNFILKFADSKLRILA
jgi:hypothetical protein